LCDTQDTKRCHANESDQGAGCLQVESGQEPVEEGLKKREYAAVGAVEANGRGTRAPRGSGDRRRNTDKRREKRPSKRKEARKQQLTRKGCWSREKTASRKGESRDLVESTKPTTSRLCKNTSKPIIPHTPTDNPGTLKPDQRNSMAKPFNEMQKSVSDFPATAGNPNKETFSRKDEQT